MRKRLTFDSRQMERIEAHIRKYGLEPSGSRNGITWTPADVIETTFVAHCAIEVCSAANLPGEHFCARHKQQVFDWIKLDQLARKLATEPSGDDDWECVPAEVLDEIRALLDLARPASEVRKEKESSS